MTINLTKLPDNTNDKYVPFYKDEHRYLVLYGSAASGKSYFIAQKILYRILTEKNHRVLIVRKVARTLRHSVFQSIVDLISQWKLTKLFHINKSEMTITYANTKSTIIFLGVDDVEKLKSIAGVTFVFIEEATELTADEFHQINLRLRGETEYYKQIMLAFNPISINNWVKKHWFDEVKKDSLVVKTTYLDNRYIDEQYKEVLNSLKETNYELYKVYALGEFGVLKGVIYPKITIVDEMPEGLENVGIGIDWGFVDPSVVVKGGFIGNDLYLDELLHQSELITREIIKYIPKEIHCYADSAEKDRIVECKRAGRWVDPAVKEVISGINRVKSYNIHITKRSFNLIKDFQIYSWKRDKEGNELEVPNHLHSDGCDAVRYFVHTSTQDKVKTQSFRLSGI